MTFFDVPMTSPVSGSMSTWDSPAISPMSAGCKFLPSRTMRMSSSFSVETTSPPLMTRFRYAKCSGGICPSKESSIWLASSVGTSDLLLFFAPAGRPALRFSPERLRVRATAPVCLEPSVARGRLTLLFRAGIETPAILLLETTKPPPPARGNRGFSYSGG